MWPFLLVEMCRHYGARPFRPIRDALACRDVEGVAPTGIEPVLPDPKAGALPLGERASIGDQPGRAGAKECLEIKNPNPLGSGCTFQRFKAARDFNPRAYTLVFYLRNPLRDRHCWLPCLLSGDPGAAGRMWVKILRRS